MAGATKHSKVPEGSHDEIIDLSAGFVPNTPAADKPELTPDVFMAQHGNHVDLLVTEPEKFDFVPEDPVASNCSEAKPITWRWASLADMQALRLHHFKAEVESDQAMYLPEVPSNLRPIAAAAKDGHVCGGLMSEDSVFVTLIGADPEVVESAREIVIPILVAQARKEGTRFLNLSLPKQLAATLDGVLQKVGFKPVSGIQYRLDTGIEADEQNSTRRN